MLGSSKMGKDNVKIVHSCDVPVVDHEYPPTREDIYRASLLCHYI
jgi:hypothetical protein